MFTWNWFQKPQFPRYYYFVIFDMSIFTKSVMLRASIQLYIKTCPSRRFGHFKQPKISASG